MTTKRRQPDGPAPTIKQLLSYRLHRVTNAISRSAAQRYRRDFDVSLGEWRTVALLAGGPPLSLSELAAEAGLDKAQMSRVVTGLTDRGLVLRGLGPGRTVRLSLTPRGNALYAGLIAAAAERNAAFLDCLSAEELRVLEAAMAKLSGLARAMLQEPG